MQIMTFPLDHDTDLGIRMTEIRKIEALTHPLAVPSGQTLCIPQLWFGLPGPENMAESKGISLSSCREVLLVVPRIGRILRIKENGPPLGYHADLPFLTRRTTLEGTVAWVIDVPVLEKHLLSNLPAKDPIPGGQEAASAPPSGPAALFQQVGQTARDIQRVLALSGSMVDSLKFMEGKLPETSHGLEVISQMTEDAAHKLMGILESLMEENTHIRKTLQAMTDPSRETREAVDLILAVLDREDQKIMGGFEAMAFQDLVGQNIKQVGVHLKELESRLVKILIETSPDAPEKSGDGIQTTASEPPFGLKGVGEKGDIDQNNVDKLLSEFGF